MEGRRKTAHKLPVSPLHFIARSFINPRRELVSRYFTMGAGALVNPRFFDERALRSRATAILEDIEEIERRPATVSFRRLNKGWTLLLPRGLSCLVARTTRFYPRTLAASHGIIGRVAAQVSRFRSVLVEISADFEKGRLGSNVMLMRGDRSWEQHPNDTPSEISSLPFSSNYKLGSIAGTRSKPTGPGPSADLNPIGYAVLRDTEVLPSPPDVTSVLGEQGSNVGQRKRRGKDVETGPFFVLSRIWSVSNSNTRNSSSRSIGIDRFLLLRDLNNFVMFWIHWIKIFRSKIGQRYYRISTRWGIIHEKKKISITKVFAIPFYFHACIPGTLAETKTRDKWFATIIRFSARGDSFIPRKNVLSSAKTKEAGISINCRNNIAEISRRRDGMHLKRFLRFNPIGYRSVCKI